MTSSRLDILDGMRGFAILIVVLYHETALTGFRLDWPPWPQPPVISLQWLGRTGFLGVELFFFISGFCLFYPFARHMIEGARRPGWREFAYRRFIKIVPSYTLALTILAIAFHGDFKDGFDVLRAYVVHLFYLHTFSRFTIAEISGPFWTIGIEVQFYLVFPLIALAFMRKPVLTWVILACGAWAYRYWILKSNMYGFLTWDVQLPAMIDTFATGMLGAYLYVRWKPHCENNARFRSMATLAAVAATLYGGYLLIQGSATDAPGPAWATYRWQMENRTLVALDCLVFCLGSAFAAGGWRETIANPILVWLSMISYNLYLWHDSFITTCHDHGFPCSFQPLPWQHDAHWSSLFFFASLALSIALATVVTYGFERPLLRLRPAWLRRPAPLTPTGQHGI